MQSGHNELESDGPKLMQVSIVKVIDKIKPLINSYSYGDYRFYKVFSKDKQSEYLLNSISRICKGKRNVILAVFEKKEAIGFSALEYLPWDSRCLGKNAWRIAHLAVKDNHSYSESVAIRKLLLNTSLSLCGYSRNNHISCKIDIADIPGIHALEDRGFKLMDTVVTWVYNPLKSTPRLRNIYHTRPFQKRDLRELMELASFSFVNNRFHSDPNIAKDKADRIYSEWIRSYCVNCGKDGTSVKVAEISGKVAGFICYKLNKEIKKITGCKIIGRGLLAVKPAAKGAGVSLINSVVKETLNYYDFAEFDGLLANNEVTNIYKKFDFKILRSKHSFHYVTN